MQNEEPIGSDEPQNPQPLTGEIVEASQIETKNDGELPTFAAVSDAEALALDLSPPQRCAISMLTSGHTAADSAKLAGVSRMTLYRWLKCDPAFIAAFNAWQQDALATARGRLLAMSDLACTTVGKAMMKGDAKTAVTLLKSMGIMKAPKPGSTDPQDVDRDRAIEHRTESLQRRKREIELDHEQYDGMR